MAISSKELSDINKVIKAFLDSKGLERKEEHVQHHFISEILKTLGWNNRNTIINETQESGTGKKPDILLKGNGGGTIFVIESKAPKESLDGKYTGKWTFAEQTCFYINSEGISWGILTNFIEWRIYNAHVYNNNQTIFKTLKIIDEKKKILLATDEQLIEFFSLIKNDFLNQNRGKIVKLDAYYPPKESIKNEFFQKLKEWRHELKQHINKKYKKELSVNQIDYQTQRILDRLIFIDVCYDKEIISQDYLGSVLYSKHEYYEELKKKFKLLDQQFNSEIFAKDKCDKFEIPNSVLEEIIKGIRRIDFSLLTVNIIGEVYESYLGELLETESNDDAVDEVKERQKRKSQGIYYTPDYIVKYIVDNTIGELLRKCKNEADIEKIKVIDPACGSGSFLIGAFDVFYAAYERVWNEKHKKKKQTDIFWELNIRKKILLHNLYGVDLDERAIEIAKLNLLLKSLEGLQITSETGHKILPNLSLNIRCGNSLVYGSYKDKDDTNRTSNKQLNLLFSEVSTYKEDIKALVALKEIFYKEEDNDEKENIQKEVDKFEEKINRYINESLKVYFTNIEEIKPFNYEVAFCEVMKNGGFDCVIGNPPYKTLQLGKKQESQKISVLNFYKDNYPSAFQYKVNLYALFLEKSISLIKKGGFFSFIIPNTFYNTVSFKDIRKYMLDKGGFNILMDLRYKVFQDAEIGGNAIFKYTKDIPQKTINVFSVKNAESFSNPNISLADLKSILNDPDFNFIIDKGYSSIYNKIKKQKGIIDLGNITKIYQGIITGDNKKFISQTAENDKWKPILKGRDINKYSLNFNNNYVYYVPEKLWSNTDETMFNVPMKIINRQTSDRLIATLDTEQYFSLDSTHVIHLTVDNVGIKYILALYNSNLINYLYQNRVKESGKVFAQVKTVNVKPLPIKLLNLKSETEKKIHDKIVSLVDYMLVLNKNPEKNRTKIDATDSEINDMVYSLYDLTKEEITLIESSS